MGMVMLVNAYFMDNATVLENTDKYVRAKLKVADAGLPKILRDKVLHKLKSSHGVEGASVVAASSSSACAASSLPAGSAAPKAATKQLNTLCAK